MMGPPNSLMGIGRMLTLMKGEAAESHVRSVRLLDHPSRSLPRSLTKKKKGKGLDWSTEGLDTIWYNGSRSFHTIAEVEFRGSRGGQIAPMEPKNKLCDRQPLATCRIIKICNKQTLSPQWGLETYATRDNQFLRYVEKVGDLGDTVVEARMRPIFRLYISVL
jgi:hypothetical protein